MSGVSVGDRFFRTEAHLKTKIYRVVFLFEPAHHPPHARLANEAVPSETVTVSVPTLLDRWYWERAKG
jgi:hypothetical protein